MNKRPPEHGEVGKARSVMELSKQRAAEREMIGDWREIWDAYAVEMAKLTGCSKRECLAPPETRQVYFDVAMPDGSTRRDSYWEPHPAADMNLRIEAAINAAALNPNLFAKYYFAEGREARKNATGIAVDEFHSEGAPLPIQKALPKPI